MVSPGLNHIFEHNLLYAESQKEGYNKIAREQTLIAQKKKPHHLKNRKKPKEKPAFHLDGSPQNRCTDLQETQVRILSMTAPLCGKTAPLCCKSSTVDGSVPAEAHGGC